MSFELSSKAQDFVKKEMKRYETKRSAILSCLQKVQEENGGYVSEESISYLSDFMKIPEAWIYEVFSFYTLFNKKPVGKYHVQICGNVTCHMNGGEKLLKQMCQHFKVSENEMTEDGKVSFSRVECLGACEGAPMAQINDSYYMNLTKEKILDLIE